MQLKSIIIKNNQTYHSQFYILRINFEEPKSEFKHIRSDKYRLNITCEVISSEDV